MVVKYVDGSGKERVKGGSELKSSQSYPLPSLVTIAYVFFLHVTTYRVSIPQLTGLLYQMGMLSYYPTSIPYILYLYGDNPSSWGPWLLRSKVHKAHPPSLPQCLGCSLRFGKAMSRLRTRFQGEVRKKARDTLKHNLKNYKCIPQNKRASAAWIKYAELDSVFDYLA